MRRTVATALVLGGLLAGCGDDGSGGGGAVDLAKWLPKDATSYFVVDVDEMRDELDLPEDAGLDSLPNGGQSAMQVLSVFERPSAVSEAIEPDSMTAGAMATLGTGVDSPTLNVVETTADTGEIGSALGDLGYSDEGGVLVPPRDLRGAPAVRLDEDLIFASADPEALRSLPDEPADDLPIGILGDVEGYEIGAVPFADLPAQGQDDCIREYAIAGDDEEGEFAYIVEGDADPERFEPQDDSRVEEIDVDGSLLVAEVRLDADQDSIRAFQADAFPRYACE